MGPIRGTKAYSQLLTDGGEAGETDLAVTHIDMKSTGHVPEC